MVFSILNKPSNWRYPHDELETPILVLGKLWNFMDIEWNHMESNEIDGAWWWEALICGLLALNCWLECSLASVSRFRTSDLLQGFKPESGSTFFLNITWPYEQPQSVTVPCNTKFTTVRRAFRCRSRLPSPVSPLSRGASFKRQFTGEWA